MTKKLTANLPLVSLIAVNALPIFGVLFLGWEVFAVLLLYWAENVVLGVYNILRMALAPVANPAEHIGKLFMIPFFAVHYGGFTAVHGIFVFAIFGKDRAIDPGRTTWPCFFAFLQMLVNTVRDALNAAPGVSLMFLALFISHGVSFVQNYLIKGERHSLNPQMLMMQPYKRIVILHVTILFGGGLAMLLGSPIPILILLIALKTAVDIALHKAEHKAFAGKQHNA